MILRFTIGACSGRQGIRTLTPSRAHSLAPRPGQPYPATFRIAADPPGVEPGPPPCHGGALPLGHEPVASIPSVDCRGIAPRSPACKAGVFLLDQQPVALIESPVSDPL